MTGGGIVVKIPATPLRMYAFVAMRCRLSSLFCCLPVYIRYASEARYLGVSSAEGACSTGTAEKDLLRAAAVDAAVLVALFLPLPFPQLDAAEDELACNSVLAARAVAGAEGGCDWRWVRV